MRKILNFFGERWENSFGDHGFGFLFSPRTSRSKLQNVNMILLDALPDATGALPNASIITTVTDICAINTFEKLLKILFSEVSASRRHCFPQLQLICLYMKY